MENKFNRRKFLTRSASILGCSAAAFPLVSCITTASAPWDNRLVIIVLRGGMDGLDVVRPIGDKNYKNLRPGILAGSNLTKYGLDGFYALNPAFSALIPMWKAGELAFAQAVSTPYRSKRSHFDGQDILEAGTGLDVPDGRIKDGWLNRVLQTVPGVHAKTAFAVGRDQLQILSGDAPVLNWAPSTRLDISPASRSLLELIYHDDPLFQMASTEAMNLAQTLDANAMIDENGELPSQMSMEMMTDKAASKADAPRQLASFTAARLQEESRIASFSIGGWDTHNNQSRVLKRGAGQLQSALLTLKKDLGPIWEKTTVLAMTEFGRSVRENGTGGTDHGTGGLMIMAGGALSGAKVHGKWPGLRDRDLYGGRDLMPATDVRSYAAWAMHNLYGIEKSLLESTIFPDLDMGRDPRILA